MSGVEFLPLLLFICLMVGIMSGYPVAFVLGGISVIFALLFTSIDIFELLPNRFFGLMQNYLLIAIPLFIFMGIMFQQSGVAEEMLEITKQLLIKIKGGLGVSIILVGAILGASTGIVGATVTTMGMLSLPVLLKNHYPPTLASGIIVSSGTLGQIIPPSIVLVLLGSVMGVSVGDLFKAALIPSFLLVLFYAIYILIVCRFKLPSKNQKRIPLKSLNSSQIIFSFLSPILLIVVVLGSIYWGLASPTEASALGALMAALICLARKKLSGNLLQTISLKTIHITAMVFGILLGASAFGLVFRELEGDVYLVQAISYLNISPELFLILLLVLMFVMGFFIDFIEIIFIFIPILLPVINILEIDLIWVSILIAINLQTSFITPPFGFSLFYLKGVASKGLKTRSIYKGAMPFVAIQIMVLAILYTFPSLSTLLI